MKGFDRAWYGVVASAVSGIFTVFTLIGSSLVLAKEFPGDFRHGFNLQQESMTAFLRRFITGNGYQVVASDNVKKLDRNLNGMMNGTATEILQKIGDTNGLTYYFDGNTLYVHLLSERMERHVVYPAENIWKLQTAVDRMGLSDKDNYVKMDRAVGLVSIFGSPPFVERMQQIVNAMNVQENVNETVLQYFPLKYAWATDRVFTVGDRDVSIPGVATILRQAIGENQEADVNYRYSDVASSAKVDSLRGKGLAALGSSESGTRIEASDQGAIEIYNSKNSTSGGAVSSRVAYQSGPSRVVANPHQNGIIIRDLAEKMPLYTKLIEQLDKATPIIEIEATIIDVNVGKLDEIGIEWRFGKDNFETLFAQADRKRNLVVTGGTDQVEFLDQVPGFQVGAIIGNSNLFVTRLNMLAKDDYINVSSRPKVATLNDLDAVIESGKALYVPVEGAFDTDLFKVQSGTLLRVTPHVIEEDGNTQIRMLINVEDGTVTMSSDENGNSVPVSSRNAVITQAIVSSGHSLLLGGLIRDEAISTENKVPFLGDIPLLGRLFRSNSDSTNRSERMYLISPRLITPEGANETANKILEKSKDLSSLTSPCEGECSEKNQTGRIKMF